MLKTWIALFAVPAALAVTSAAHTRSGGIYNTAITRTTPACGSCHRASPGAGQGFPTLTARLEPTARSLVSGQALSVRISATGGQNASSLGGFAVDATAGAFAAGAGTRTHAQGSAITHSRPGPRDWTFGFTAPSNPGKVELRGVVNTVDGDGNDDSADMWAFAGFDGTATQATAVPVFVNATGVQPIGTSCVGSFGNVPVLGAAQAPTVGNSGFALEVHGAPTSSPLGILLGANPNFTPIDLTIIGIDNCTLYVDAVFTLPSTTSAGSSERGEGSATIPLPVPADNTLRGNAIEVQAAIADFQNGRTIAVTMTNGLSVTFQ